MNLVLIAALTAVCSAAKLDHTHLPPASAKTAGGSSGSLLAPVFRSSSEGFGSFPTGGYTNNFQGVVVDAAAAGTRASSASEESGLGGPRDSYGSTNSKVGDAAFKDSVAGFRSSPFGLNVGFGGQKSQSNLGFGLFNSKTEKTQALKDRNSNTLAFAHDVGTNKYNYGFETDNGISVGENGVAAGGVQAQGGYSYKGDDGQEYKVTYTAGKDGYRPRGDHLPTPPPIPYEIVKSLEQNAQEEAAGLVHDGSYDAQKYNVEGDYADDNSGNMKYNEAQSTQFGKRPESDATTSGTLNHNSQLFGKPSTVSGLFGFGFNSQQNSNAFISTNTANKKQYNQITGSKFESVQTPLNDVDQSQSKVSGNLQPSSSFGSSISKPSHSGQNQVQNVFNSLPQTINRFGSTNGYLPPVSTNTQGLKPAGLINQNNLSTDSSLISSQQPVKTQFGSQTFNSQGVQGSLSAQSQASQLSGNLKPSTSFASSVSKPSLLSQSQLGSAFGSGANSVAQSINKGTNNEYLPPVNSNEQGLKPQGLFSQNSLSTGSNLLLSQKPVKTQFGTQALKPQEVQSSLSTLNQNTQLSSNLQPSTSLGSSAFGSSISNPSLPGQSQIGNTFGTGAKPQSIFSQSTVSTGSSSSLSQQPVKSQIGVQTFNSQGSSLSTLSQNTLGSGNLLPTSIGSSISTPFLPGQSQVSNTFGSAHSTNKFPETPNKFGTEYLPPVKSTEQGLQPQQINTFASGIASSLNQEENGNKQSTEKYSPINSHVHGQPEGSSASASASIGQPAFGVQPVQPLSYQVQTSQPYINKFTQKPLSSQVQLGSITNLVQPSPTSSYTFNTQQPTAVPLTELTTPLEPHEPSHVTQSSQPATQSISNFATSGSQSSNSYPTNTQLGISSNNVPTASQTLSPTLSHTFSTLSSSRPHGISSQQFGASLEAIPTQVTQKKEPTSQIPQFGYKNPQSTHNTFSQGQFGVSSTQKPSFGQSVGNDNAYYYNQPLKPFSTPQPAPQGSRFPSKPSYQTNGLTQPPQSNTPFSNYNQNLPANALPAFSKYPNSPSLAPVGPTTGTQKETGQNQGIAFSSNYNGITQASISPFPSVSPTASTQFSTPQISQFGSTSTFQQPSRFPQQTTVIQQSSPQKPGNQLGLKPTTSQSHFQSIQSPSSSENNPQISSDKSSPSMLIQQYQGTLYEYNKPAESLPAATHIDSTSSQSEQGSSESKPQIGLTQSSQISINAQQITQQGSKPQFGIQSTSNRLGQNSQSAQQIKPFSNAPFTTGSGSFGLQISQGYKPQFGSQTSYNQPIKPFGSTPSTPAPSSFVSQTTQETKPQFGIQSTSNQFGHNTQSAQTNKPFGSGSSTEISSSFGSQINQETKPQIGIQSNSNQFGLNTQAAQTIKPFGTPQESKPQFGTQATYNKFEQNTQSAQSIKPFGSVPSTAFSSSFGLQTTQEVKPQFGTQSTFNQFGLNTQSAQSIKPFGTTPLTQVSSSFGSHTTQETKPQLGTQITYNTFGQNTQSAESIKPSGSASFAGVSSLFGSQATQETKPQFSIQSTYNKFSQNMQSVQPSKPFGSILSTQTSGSFGSQPTQESKPQLGTQTTYNKFEKNTQSAQSIKPFSTVPSTPVSSAFGSQITQGAKPQIGTQSTFNQFGLNTQLAQSIKPFDTTPSTPVSSSFGSHTTQETKPQFGTQSTFNQFGQHTQASQTVKPLENSVPSTQTSSSTGSQTIQDSKPQFGTQITYNTFGQNTQSAESIKPSGSASSAGVSSSFGSQTIQETKPQFGIQSNYNKFSQDTQSAQPIKPFGSISSTQTSSSFGSQPTQESKPQFVTQTTYNQFEQNTQSAQSIKPFSTVLSTPVSSSFGSQIPQESKPQHGTQSTYNQFGQNTQSAQTYKPFGSGSSTDVFSSFGSQITQETKPQFGIQSNSNHFGLNTEAVQTIKPFDSTQESKPQLGTQSIYNQFGQNTQSAQSIKPFSSTSSSKTSSSFGSQTTQESKPQSGIETIYNTFEQNTQSVQSIKPSGIASSAEVSSSFGSQNTQETKPQFGTQATYNKHTQSTYNKFGQNTQSPQPIKPFGSVSSAQASSLFGSQTTQESKPQFGTQSTYNKFGENTQSTQHIKPLDSKTSSSQASSSFGSQTTQSPFNQFGQNTQLAQTVKPLGNSVATTQVSSSFGSKTTQEAKPQFGTQSTYSYFGQNTQSAQSVKPFGSSSTPNFSSFGYQTSQGSKQQFGSQSTYNHFGQNTHSNQANKPFGSIQAIGQTGHSSQTQFGTQSFKPFGSTLSSSATGSQTVGSASTGASLGSAGSSIAASGNGKPGQGFDGTQDQLSFQSTQIDGQNLYTAAKPTVTGGKGETFGGPKQPTKFDENTGYYY